MAGEARAAIEALGFREVRDTVPWREAFADLTDEALPGTALRGARVKEGLTQVELSRRTGIPQRHISEIENGKRQVGRDRALKLARALNVDYRILI